MALSERSKGILSFCKSSAPFTKCPLNNNSIDWIGRTQRNKFLPHRIDLGRCNIADCRYNQFRNDIDSLLTFLF